MVARRGGEDMTPDTTPMSLAPYGGIKREGNLEEGESLPSDNNLHLSPSSPLNTRLLSNTEI